MLRRSGRTTELLRAAVRLAEQGQKVNFVVWHEREIGHVMDILHQQNKDVLRYQRLSVIPYSYARRYYHGTVCVYDHRVTEELEYERTGRRHKECIQIVLECNGWEKVETIPLMYWNTGCYRMAMCEPLNTLAYELEEYTGDASATVKIVEFYRTDRVNKDGLIVFAHKG